MKSRQITHRGVTALAVLAFCASAGSVALTTTDPVDDSVIADQREQLAKNSVNRGFGPQSPRDIDSRQGENSVSSGAAPAATAMNLCNIHFHSGAEHKGGEFTTYAGNGNGKGYGSGYLYNGKLSQKQLAAFDGPVCGDKKHSLKPGDTLEVHFVHSTALVEPGPTLNSCLAESIQNPQLRVETQVIVLANDRKAVDFVEMTKVEQIDGYFQAPNLPSNTGEPVQYQGSTTGPAYNKHASPYLVSWSVRPKVAVVDIASVASWCEGNEFDEYHAHGVRNLVTNPDLLSPIRTR